MAHIDDLMDVTSTKFHLAMLAAKRAREINNYYQQLGEGSGRWIAPLVSTESNKPLTIALEEIAQGKIVEAEPTEQVVDDPFAFIAEDELDIEADDVDETGEAGEDTGPDLQVLEGGNQDDDGDADDVAALAAIGETASDDDADAVAAEADEAEADDADDE